MVIKCNLDNSFYNYSFAPKVKAEPSFRGVHKMAVQNAKKNADKFVMRPIANKSAIGLISSENSFLRKSLDAIKERFTSYKENIAHTYKHKVIFAIVEKELFGKNTMDCITHDLDKLILYTLGFSKSFVSKFHRQHSEHHIESRKKMNLHSMICDNIASSPEFKPEKRYHLRELYQMSPDLQSVTGLGDALEKYNFGESLDFAKINAKREKRAKRMENATKNVLKVVSSIILFPIKLFI